MERRKGYRKKEENNQIANNVVEKQGIRFGR